MNDLDSPRAGSAAEEGGDPAYGRMTRENNRTTKVDGSTTGGDDSTTREDDSTTREDDRTTKVDGSTTREDDRTTRENDRTAGDFPPPGAGETPVPPFPSSQHQPAVAPTTPRGPSFQPQSGTLPSSSAPPPRTPKPRMTRRAARILSHSTDDDQKVRDAAMSVGVAVAVASGAVVFLGCLVLIVIVMVNAVQVPTGFEPAPDNGRIVRPGPRWGWLNAYEVIWTVAIVAILSLVLTSLVAWFMARRAVRPLTDALRLQRDFVADASHELRTPLTALSSRVQILQRRLDNGKPIDDVVTQLLGDTANMARVLDDMLLTAEGAPAEAGTKTSVVACLRQAVTSLAPLAEQKDIAVTLRASCEMMVAVPETSLTRAVVAIVDNAIQHSPAQSDVDVSAQVVGSMAVIRVSDHGGGIAGVDPDRVFDRFAHGSETGQKRNFGLGLALASGVAHRFGGDIRVESTSEKGTTFALSFPLCDQAR